MQCERWQFAATAGSLVCPAQISARPRDQLQSYARNTTCWMHVHYVPTTFAYVLLWVYNCVHSRIYMFTLLLYLQSIHRKATTADAGISSVLRPDIKRTIVYRIYPGVPYTHTWCCNDDALSTIDCLNIRDSILIDVISNVVKTNIKVHNPYTSWSDQVQKIIHPDSWWIFRPSV